MRLTGEVLDFTGGGKGWGAAAAGFGGTGASGWILTTVAFDMFGLSNNELNGSVRLVYNRTQWYKQHRTVQFSSADLV